MKFRVDVKLERRHFLMELMAMKGADIEAKDLEEAKKKVAETIFTFIEVKDGT